MAEAIAVERLFASPFQTAKTYIGSKIRAGFRAIGQKIAGGVRRLGYKLGIGPTASELMAPTLASLPISSALRGESFDYIDRMAYQKDKEPNWASTLYKARFPEGELKRIRDVRGMQYQSPQLAAYRSNVAAEKAAAAIARKAKGARELRMLSR